MSTSSDDVRVVAAPSDAPGPVRDWIEESPGTEQDPDPVRRQLLDDLAAAREELAVQAASAREARSVISANEARFLVALDALTEERDTLAAGLEAAEARSAAAETRAAAAEEQLAEVGQRLATQLARSQALEAELAALRATRTMRWSRVPRELYRIHVRGEPPSGERDSP